MGWTGRIAWWMGSSAEEIFSTMSTGVYSENTKTRPSMGLWYMTWAGLHRRYACGLTLRVTFGLALLKSHSTAPGCVRIEVDVLVAGASHPSSLSRMGSGVCVRFEVYDYHLDTVAGAIAVAFCIRASQTLDEERYSVTTALRMNVMRTNDCH